MAEPFDIRKWLEEFFSQYPTDPTGKNILTPSGLISLQRLENFFSSPQGLQYATWLNSSVGQKQALEFASGNFTNFPLQPSRRGQEQRVLEALGNFTPSEQANLKKRFLERFGVTDLSFAQIEDLDSMTAQLNIELSNRKQLLLADVATPGGREKLKAAVDVGTVPWQEAYGAGSAWEKWQQGQAAESNKYKGYTPEGYTAQLKRAEREGLTQFKGKEEDTFPSQVQAGIAVEALGRQINEAIEQRNYTEAQKQSVLSPKWYAQYQKEVVDPARSRGSTYRPESFYQGGFPAWLKEQPAYETEQVQERQKRYEDSPFLAQRYEKYLSEVTPTIDTEGQGSWQIKPWGTWKAEQPEYTALEEERRRRMGQAGAQLAPRTRWLTY